MRRRIGWRLLLVPALVWIGAPAGAAPEPAALATLPAKAKQAIAWGRAAGDLQLGARFTAEPHPYQYGDALELEVLLRNTGKSTINCVVPQDLAPGSGNVPDVRNERGEHVTIRSVIYLGIIPLLPHTLKPGETETLGRLRVLIHPPNEEHPADAQLRMGAAPGKYRLTQHESIRLRDTDTKYLNLETGRLAFEVAAPSK